MVKQGRPGIETVLQARHDQATTIENQLGTSRDAVGDRLFLDSLGIRRTDRAKVGLRAVIRPYVDRLAFRYEERDQLIGGSFALRDPQDPAIPPWPAHSYPAPTQAA